jgi:hypothetical protein
MKAMVSFGLSILLFAVTASSLAQSQSMQGTFVLVPQKSDDVEKAIVTAVSKVNFILRPKSIDHGPDLPARSGAWFIH